MCLLALVLHIHNFIIMVFILYLYAGAFSQLYYSVYQPDFLYSQPLDVVLGLLGDELNSLKDVGYVIDAPLLDIQNL